MATRRGTYTGGAGTNGRGGKRQGRAGAAYPNRTDLNTAPRTTAPAPAAQPVRTATGQAYGVAGAQQAAQQAIPLPAPTPLMAPTQRPAEPVTAGMSMGAGGGQEMLHLPPQRPVLTPEDDLESTLMGLYLANPNNDMTRLLVAAQARRASPS